MCDPLLASCKTLCFLQPPPWTSPPAIAFLARSISNSLLSPKKDETNSAGPAPFVSLILPLHRAASARTSPSSLAHSRTASRASPHFSCQPRPRAKGPHGQNCGQFLRAASRGSRAIAELAKTASLPLPPEGGKDWAHGSPTRPLLVLTSPPHGTGFTCAWRHRQSVSSPRDGAPQVRSVLSHQRERDSSLGRVPPLGYVRRPCTHRRESRRRPGKVRRRRDWEKSPVQLVFTGSKSFDPRIFLSLTGSTQKPANPFKPN